MRRVSVASRLKIRPYAAESFDDLTLQQVAEVECLIEAEGLMHRDKSDGRRGNRSTAMPPGSMSLEEAFGMEE